MVKPLHVHRIFSLQLNDPPLRQVILATGAAKQLELELGYNVLGQPVT